MSSENGQKLDVRNRITAFIKAQSKTERKQPSQEDNRTLEVAMGRLDELLTDIRTEPRDRQVTEADLKTLRAAAANLNRLLRVRKVPLRPQR